MMPIPPWRRVHALFSKWFPSSNKSRRMKFSAPSSLFDGDGRVAQAV
jgi:hypothetical protein